MLEPIGIKLLRSSIAMGSTSMVTDDCARDIVAYVQALYDRASAGTVNVDTLKEIMAEARRGVADHLVHLRVEADMLRAQNESLRKRLDNDENKRLQGKLDRATKRIAEMVREREGLLRVVTNKELTGIMKSHFDECVAHEKAEKERDEWKAKAEALHWQLVDISSKLGAVAKIVGRPALSFGGAPPGKYAISVGGRRVAMANIAAGDAVSFDLIGESE